MSIKIRPARPEDAGPIAAIYNHYILDTVITFEEKAVAGADILSRMKEVEELALPWLTAEDNGKILGYAYGGKWKGRCAYRYTTESTIYLDKDATGKGLGLKLYTALLAEFKNRKLHAAIGGIALPNEPSVKLHEKLGFVKVAHFKELGWKFGKWIDVGYWQVTL